MRLLTFTSAFDAPTYNYWIEVCALVFLVCLFIRFIAGKKFLSKVNIIFGAAIVCGIVDLFLDVLSCVLLDHYDIIPAEFNEFVNGSFYFFQILFPILLFIFLVYLAGITNRQRKRMLLCLIPAVLYQGVIITNPFTHLVFHIDYSATDGVFKHGPLFVVFYIVAGFYLVLTLLSAYLLRSKIEKSLVTSIMFSVIFNTLMITIQMIFPEYLLTGLGISIACWANYEHLENAGDMIDKVTGVYNYNAYISYIKEDIRFTKKQYMIVLNIDKITAINTTFGIETGNHVYKEIGSFFNSINQGKAWVFRLFNSRFVMACKDEISLKIALDTIESRFEMPWKVEDKSFELDVAAYYLDGDVHATTAAEFIEFIDSLDVNFKADTEHKIVCIDQNYIEVLARAKKVETAILKAMNNNFKGFEMYYQPIFQVSTSKFNHAEALLRFTDPELGAISPSEFIPIVESCGRAHEVDIYVLKATCDFLRSHPQIDFLDINVSCAEFFSNPSAEFIDIVKQLGIDPKKICFEVTETATVKYPEKLEEFMNDLEKEGFSFAIDDFGTGYSNIARVISRPFSLIKLDKSFLKEDNKMDKILESVVLLLHKIKCPIVIEGVETKKQYERMVNLGIEYVQGYYLAKPMPKETYIQFIDKK